LRAEPAGHPGAVRDRECNRDLRGEGITHLVYDIVGAVLAALRALELGKFLEDELVVV
jgi:hypothetical protein